MGKLQIDYIKKLIDWDQVYISAQNTIGKDGSGNITDKFKRMMLLSEHSPIRELTFKWRWKNLRSWVSVHFVRHFIGILHYVRTQRTDRTGINRDELRQDNKIKHMATANAQAIINMSRKRLCSKASQKTIEAWKLFLNELNKIEPILAEKCVPECYYRGFCPLGNKGCGRKLNKNKLEEYRRIY